MPAEVLGLLLPPLWEPPALSSPAITARPVPSSSVRDRVCWLTGWCTAVLCEWGRPAADGLGSKPCLSYAWRQGDVLAGSLQLMLHMAAYYLATSIHVCS